MINILIKSITALKFNLVSIVPKILMFFPYISMECTVFTICNILYMCLAFPKFTMFLFSLFIIFEYTEYINECQVHMWTDFCTRPYLLNQHAGGGGVGGVQDLAHNEGLQIGPDHGAIGHLYHSLVHVLAEGTWKHTPKSLKLKAEKFYYG